MAPQPFGFVEIEHSVEGRADWLQKGDGGQFAGIPAATVVRPRSDFDVSFRLLILIG